jgi:hypothetical protein
MVLVLFGIVVPFDGAVGSTPLLTISPGQGVASAQVLIQGTGFPARARVEFTWDASPTTWRPVRVGNDGSFSSEVIIPAAAPTAHVVTAGTQPTGKRREISVVASATFQVQQAATPSLTVAPTPSASPLPPPTGASATPVPSSAGTTSPSPTGMIATPAPTAVPPAPAPTTATPTATARPQGGIFAYYYLWWSARHWHDKLGMSYAYSENPLPLPAVIGTDGCSTVSTYAGNQLTDVPASLASQDQDDPVSVERDVRNAASAGLRGFFVNWLGTGLAGQTINDVTYSRRLQYVVDAAHKVTAEGTPFFVVLSYRGSLDAPRTESQVMNDFDYLRRTYANDGALWRPYGSRPMLVWEGSRDYPGGTIGNVSAAFRSSFFLMADEDANTWQGHAAYFDGATRYFSTQQATQSSFDNMKVLGDQVHASAVNPDGSRKLWYSSFTPGHNSFLLTGSTNCTPRNDGQTMVRLFDGNSASDPDGWALISWNEIAEGTYVLPMQRYGARYLDVLRQLAAR